MTDVTDNTKNKQLGESNILQDNFLRVLEEEKRPVSLYLVNGIKLQGIIVAADAKTILLHQYESSAGKLLTAQLVYKTAISTVVPQQPFDLHKHLSS